MNNCLHHTIFGLAFCFFLLAMSEWTDGDTVDFETGFVDMQQLSAITTATNVIGFSVSGGGPIVIAQVGAPITAFEPNDDPVGGFPGSFFMSDGTSTVARDYFFTFDRPISSLSLDLYDFEASGRTATLSVFAGSDFSQLLTQDSTGGSTIDGGVVSLNIPFAPESIRSASLTFDIGDNGVGIDNISFSTIPDQIVPNSVVITRGLHVAGGVAELHKSDNVDLSISRSNFDVQSRTEFEIKAVSPFASPTSFEIRLEGAVFARSPVNQTIELFDYDTATWEVVDARAAMRLSDSIAEIVVQGDPSRFIEPGTNCIEARIRYQSVNGRQQFSSNTDQFLWLIGR